MQTYDRTWTRRIPRRIGHAKREVTIYDYVDEKLRVLARMAAKRRSAYQALGYGVIAAPHSEREPPPLAAKT